MEEGENGEWLDPHYSKVSIFFARSEVTLLRWLKT